MFFLVKKKKKKLRIGLNLNYNLNYERKLSPKLHNTYTPLCHFNYTYIHPILVHALQKNLF